MTGTKMPFHQRKESHEIIHEQISMEGHLNGYR